jgi:hypothetical protein
MSGLLLYEIHGEPKSAYLNAIELFNVDFRREIFLTDILQYFSDSPVGCNFTFYAVVKDQLVWLDAPTCLVPICPDGIIRLVLKPASFPPFIHLKQYSDFADKSRIQFYSRSDYERTGEYAHRTFHDTGRVVSQYLKQRAQTRAAAQAASTVSAADLDNFFPSQPMADPWATGGTNSAADQQQFGGFARFIASTTGRAVHRSKKLTQTRRSGLAGTQTTTATAIVTVPPGARRENNTKRILTATIVPLSTTWTTAATSLHPPVPDPAATTRRT